jgi:HD domain
MSRLSADELAPTGAPAACLQTLRAATGRHDEPMERHCVRSFVIAERLAADAGQDIDRELLLCASLLHDVGIFESVATRDHAYVTDGRRVALETVAPFAWPAQRRRLLGDTIEQHHAQTSRDGLGHEVELMRRADLVDVSRGLVSFGLPRSWLRGLSSAVPRRGFYALLAREIGRMLRNRPQTLPAVFMPPPSGRAEPIV